MASGSSNGRGGGGSRIRKSTNASKRRGQRAFKYDTGDTPF